MDTAARLSPGVLLVIERWFLSPIGTEPRAGRNVIAVVAGPRVLGRLRHLNLFVAAVAAIARRQRVAPLVRLGARIAATLAKEIID
jgi:hypothetical protein